MADTATASTMPQGTRRRGSTVSSDTLADASNPVNVHCACSNPTTNAHQYGQPAGFDVIGTKKNASGCFQAGTVLSKEPANGLNRWLRKAATR